MSKERMTLKRFDYGNDTVVTTYPQVIALSHIMG
jgi:hypothetical protein